MVQCSKFTKKNKYLFRACWQCPWPSEGRRQQPSCRRQPSLFPQAKWRSGGGWLKECQCGCWKIKDINVRFTYTHYITHKEHGWYLWIAVLWKSLRAKKNSFSNSWRLFIGCSMVLKISRLSWKALKSVFKTVSPIASKAFDDLKDTVLKTLYIVHYSVHCTKPSKTDQIS